MRQKRLMLLGGIRYLLPVIEAAHKQGYYVITADYLPNNIAHQYSDEYVNVSIVDREAVLQTAIEKRIDGIMSFGVDPGVISAAYVQDRLDLPAFGPLSSVEILQNKDRFRAFLSANGFNVPESKGYSSISDALNDVYFWKYPVIVKPTDSAGSKGVTRVDNEDNLLPALEKAFSFSVSRHVIIESFIEKRGYSSDSDCFLENGQLVFTSFSSQRFDSDASNPYTPAAYSWPSSFSKKEIEYFQRELQRLFSLLKMRTGVYNVETRVGLDGRPYLMEVTPRGGGNRLSEVIRFATGVDMITASVRACVGDSVEGISQKPFIGHWAEIILHGDKQGRFDRIDIDESIERFIFEKDIWVERGAFIHAFHGANDAIGTLVLKFSDEEVMQQTLANINKMVHIVVGKR